MIRAIKGKCTVKELREKGLINTIKEIELE